MALEICSYTRRAQSPAVVSMSSSLVAARLERGVHRRVRRHATYVVIVAILAFRRGFVFVGGSHDGF